MGRDRELLIDWGTQCLYRRRRAYARWGGQRTVTVVVSLAAARAARSKRSLLHQPVQGLDGPDLRVERRLVFDRASLGLNLARR